MVGEAISVVQTDSARFDEGLAGRVEVSQGRASPALTFRVGLALARVCFRGCAGVFKEVAEVIGFALSVLGARPLFVDGTILDALLFQTRLPIGARALTTRG